MSALRSKPLETGRFLTAPYDMPGKRWRLPDEGHTSDGMRTRRAGLRPAQAVHGGGSAWPGGEFSLVA
ncbi:hypothetical protein Srubr_35870 [Streptomyces rubradiris]|uniref:Uncharacterized protein n=1 Tax=Streptomyces rubradiris TaxID=285531 RepID=A0ABQ3RD19_STRRR|nr:hypothetical protein Srubr_35870 [Streptomyces rubradiris]